MNPFTKPAAPRSSLETLRWVIFEPLLLRKYADTLNRSQVLWQLLKAYLWVALFTALLYVAGTALLAGFDWFGLPVCCPDEFTTFFLREWFSLSDFQSRFFWLLDDMFVGLAAGLAVGLIVLLVYDLTAGLEGGLAAGLAFGLILGLAGGLIYELTRDLFGLMGGFTFGLTYGLGFSLRLSLTYALGLGLVGGLGLGLLGVLSRELVAGVSFGFSFIFFFYLSYFRLIFYPVYLPGILFGPSFHRNPYLHDAVIWLPIPFLTHRLCQDATKNPTDGFAFADFLLEYRPLQHGLAQHILHAATAGHWRNHPLDPDHLRAPRLVDNQEKLHPSSRWLEALDNTRASLTSARTHNQISFKTAAFGKLKEVLDEFRRQTLLESPRWKHDYLDAIDTWRQAAQAALADLEQQALAQEPITPNVYRPGDALYPAAEKGREIFMGRTDLKDALASAIFSAPAMPMLLIQGQRRVGKTSLLHFLPELLGPGFRLVYQDCQQGFGDMGAWLRDLRRRADKALGRRESAWTPPDEWLAAWAELQAHLEAAMQDKNFKLILALDEYESLHDLLQEDPKTGGRLLGAMRSFSQHQNRVVFLFCGAALFSELDAPDWSHYFVHAVRFRVDYLPKPDALRLITEPVKLVYPPAVPERLFELTQGHPALLQLVCKHLVDIANRDMRKQMTAADLDEALERALDRETLAIAVFWRQFCALSHCRDTVLEILAGKPPAHRPSLARLQEHGYIVSGATGRQLRVPLFAEWVRRFGEI